MHNRPYWFKRYLVRLRIFLEFRVSRAEWIYLLKCILGVSFCYIFFALLPQYPMYWAMISVLLVFSPEHNNRLAHDRIRSNVLGGVVGFAVFFLPLPNFVLVCIGTSLTILIGIYLRLERTLRSALAALIIVLVQEVHEKDWIVAFERISCVCLGCITALIVNYIFSKFTKRYQP